MKFSPRFCIRVPCWTSVVDRIRSASSVIRDDPEGGGRIAREHAPAPLQFLAHGLFQRVAPGVVILARGDEVAVERARTGAIEQRQRIGPAVEIDRRFCGDG